MKVLHNTEVFSQVYTTTWVHDSMNTYLFFFFSKDLSKPLDCFVSLQSIFPFWIELIVLLLQFS